MATKYIFWKSNSFVIYIYEVVKEADEIIYLKPLGISTILYTEIRTDRYIFNKYKSVMNESPKTLEEYYEQE